MKVISFCSLKGGVGKSTLCFLCARYLSQIGRTVLCIDLDRQNTLTTYCVCDQEQIKNHHIIKALLEKNLYSHTLKIQDNFFFIPCTFSMNNLEHIRSYALKELLQDSRENYDHCLIDCAPHVDLAMINAIHASDMLIAPINFNQADCVSAIALKKILTFETGCLSKLRFLCNKTPPIKSKNPKTLANQYKRLFQESLEESLLQTTIPEMRTMSKVIDTGVTIKPERNQQKLFFGIASLIHEIFGLSQTPQEF